MLFKGLGVLYTLFGILPYTYFKLSKQEGRESKSVRCPYLGFCGKKVTPKRYKVLSVQVTFKEEKVTLQNSLNDSWQEITQRTFYS